MAFESVLKGIKLLGFKILRKTHDIKQDLSTESPNMFSTCINLDKDSTHQLMLCNISHLGSRI